MAKFSIKDGEGIIPSRTTVINRHAFCLESIIVPSSVTKIEAAAFSGCPYLDSIAVSEENPIYDSRESCNAIIETATSRLIVGCRNTLIPQSVTEIGDNAFEGCTGLTSIVIPDSVTEIGNNAFEGCTRLTSIVISSLLPIKFLNTLPDQCPNLKHLFVPASLLDEYNDEFSIELRSLVSSY